MKIMSITHRLAGCGGALGLLAGVAAAVVPLAVGAAAAQAAFPGKNGRIAFTRVFSVSADSAPEPFSLVIQTASPTGRARRTLRTCPDNACLFKGSDPAWSPGGRFLAFTSLRRPTLKESARGRIGVIRSDGDAPRLLPRLTDYDVEPAWSPRGRSFAFGGYVSHQGHGVGIHTARTDGSHRRQPTTPPEPGGDSQPSWSLTGKIAFTRDAYPAPRGIYVMNPDGSALQRLTNGRDPDWSPRGRYIAFTGRDAYVYIMRSDGSAPRRLTRGAEPAWSPDGKWIAFARHRDLFVVRTDGSGLRRIAKGKAVTKKGIKRVILYTQPSWQPRR